MVQPFPSGSQVTKFKALAIYDISDISDDRKGPLGIDCARNRVCLGMGPERRLTGHARE
jgi:hypothetical protein